jgi:uncharacterized membrane protein affecting hemolysin expression
MIALLALCCAACLVGVVILGVLQVRQATQLRAVARLTSLTARLIERQTGAPLPTLETELLDAAEPDAGEDEVSQIRLGGPWELPEIETVRGRFNSS